MNAEIYRRFQQKTAKNVPEFRIYEASPDEIKIQLRNVMGTEELAPVFQFLCSPDIEFPWTFESLRFFDIRQLAESQIGFRLIKTKDNKFSLNDKWPNSYFAIGAHVTDPIIVDIGDKAYPVLRGVTGVPGEYKLLAQSSDDYFITLNLWLEIVVEKYSGKFYEASGKVNLSLVTELELSVSPYLVEGAFQEWLNE